MKNAYGITPWGKWFIDVLNSYEMGARLDRGRSYANTGKVYSLSIDNGKAIAMVEGNYRPFYHVEIAFSPLKQAEQVYKLIEEEPPLQALIAAGELPEAFLLKLKKKGIKLIPERWEDMDRVCTCPDYGDPCKHMAALYYVIAKEIDTNPHVLFKLRGMDLAARFGSNVVHQIKAPFEISYKAKEKPGAKNLPALTAGSPGKDSAIEPEPVERKFNELQLVELQPIPGCRELISSLLPPFSSFSDKNFALVISEFYERCSLVQNWEQGKIKEEELAEIEHHFSRSHWSVICTNPKPGAAAQLLAEDINGNKIRYSLYDAFSYFVHFSSEDGTASYSFLFNLFKFLNLVLSASAFIPYVFAENGKLRIIWQPFETLPSVSGMLRSIALRECGMLSRSAGTSKKQKEVISGQSTVALLASAFLNEWVKKRFPLFRGSFNKHGTGEGFWALLNMFFQGTSIDVSSPAQRSLPAAIDQWLSVLHVDFTSYGYSLTVKPVNPKNADTGGLSYSISMEVLVDEGDKIKKVPLSQVTDPVMLRAPMALSNYLVEIRDLASPSLKAASKPVELSEARLVSFLNSAVPLIKRLGIKINLPKELHRELKPRLVVKGDQKREGLVTFLDLNSLHNFEWQIAIGDQLFTYKEFEELLSQKQALIRFKDGFVKMDIEEFRRLLNKAKSKTPGFNDFLKAHFSGDSVLDFDARGKMEQIFREQDLPIPPALNAVLRPYQKRGYNWVCSHLFSGFGCILADDMGLGKTVQSIAAIMRLKENGLLQNGCLVVAPAALLNNWEKELARFAPSLTVSRYHGTGRQFGKEQDVLLTTYQTAVRDAEKFKKISFSILIVDEAHLMKNAETKISKTVKQLRSQYRLALSGTPVENRLEDLRSLFDFILPGYLGSAPEFREQYRVPIEVMRDREKAELLRKITAPFLLRRLKTDKTIIKDLPEKIITNNYAVLEKDQTALYKSVVDDSIEKSETCDPKDRASLILKLLTSLKQICDHPRVFDKESPAVSKLSGKALLLLTLLEEILANREKTLIFSQYVETLDCLERIIKKELGEAPLVYHGGLSQKNRTETINRFQEDPGARIMLVSLKAGGLGLNLTAASRVIHYDLWYNPAVENQATDRAFRIGQKRTVFVHRFITKNSFEEKIDAMITNKRELADMTVSSGESWLARMSHEELRELFER